MKVVRLLNPSPMTKLRWKKAIPKVLAVLPILVTFFGCAADPIFPFTASNPSQTAVTQTLKGARVTFYYSDYYSLTSPNPATGCAGDAALYYDPISMVLPSYPSGYQGYQATTGPEGPLELPINSSVPTETIRPSFIKNVSVDVTNANLNSSSNLSYSCSLQSSNASPSTCATFDYGAIGGVPTNLGGTLVMIGGLQSINYDGIQTSATSHGLALSCGPANLTGTLANYCGTSMFGLAVNTLPSSAAGTSLAPGISSSSDPISTWTNYSSSQGYSGPSGVAGGSLIYDSVLQDLLLFGGAAPLSASAPQGLGTTTYDTWVYDIKLETWTHQSTNFVVNPNLQITNDYFASNQPISQLQKPLGGRALFGYAAIPGTAISQLSTTGSVTGVNGATIDTTDRIFIIGGLGNNCTFGTACTDTHRLNPTFGPEYFDFEHPSNSPNSVNAGEFPTQWIDSYPIQLVSNSTASSNYIPSAFPTPNPTAPSPAPIDSSISFGMVALNNNNPSSPGVGVTALSEPAVGSVNLPGAGYPLVAGGFHGYSGQPGYLNTPSGACASITQCGSLEIALKWFNNAWTQAVEQSTANFTSATNTNQTVNLNSITPSQWKSIADTGGGNTTPWYGGGVMLKGLDISGLGVPALSSGAAPVVPANPPNDATNQVVFFGGADCSTYMTSTTQTCPNWNPSSGVGNPGRYWVFGTDPANSFNPNISQYPPLVAMAGTAPMNAGMAAARGLDSAGNPLIVAWGGMIDRAKNDTTGAIYYLYNNGGTPTWSNYIPSSGPQGLANAAMVYSHVTGNFYVFGGYNTNTGTSGDTWQLSITTPGCATSGGCQFSWKLLNQSTGLTCYPSCPSGRRSHRMVEANYNYFNAPFEPDCSSASRPCSFGIFMEGGTANGFSPYYNDRWMFDPTANGGAGNWQQLGELPPRTLASMASVNYQIPATSTVTHRAILFGGETGMQSPLNAASGYFVPPTLGDTWMYDFDTGNWNRVSLYGHRYDTSATNNGSPPTLNLPATSIEARASSLVTDTTTTEFSPPPTSGGIMVTRPYSKANHLSSDSTKTLAIPEVFFFGGRKKDGTYNLLSTVYKFCAGTTGEKPATADLAGNAFVSPDDASCDAYDTTTNPNSQSPVSDYVGRWLLKSPPIGAGNVDPSARASFMGAGAYDSTHDLVILFGGLLPAAAPMTTAAVTDASNQMLDSNVLEYTPPSSLGLGAASAGYNGSWNLRSFCAESPSVPQGRYGHTLAYSALDQSLIVVGGYDINGNLLTQTETFSDGTSTTIPEVWAGYRIDSSLESGIPSKNIPAITTGPFPCYYWKPITRFGNSDSTASQMPPTSGLAHTANIFIPSSGYNSGYYTTNDSACVNNGPIASPDPDVSKLLVGGAYFDIDRTQMGANENLLLNLTFLPMGTSNSDSNQSTLTTADSAIFKVHLIKTGQTTNEIQSIPQPRDLTYASTDQYPEIVQDLSIIAPPTGEIRQEQVFIPMSMDSSIDRIRIERYSGNAILIDATLFRIGPSQ